MSFQWVATTARTTLLEVHDIIAAPGTIAQLPPLFGIGMADFGAYAVDNHPGRLVLLRDFADRAARHDTYSRHFARPAWREARALLAERVVHHRVVLTRVLRPAEGLVARPLGPLQLLASELRDRDRLGDYHLWLRLLLRKAGLDPIACFASYEAVNDVPAIPVLRDRIHHLALLADAAPSPALPPELLNSLRFPPERLRLVPILPGMA